MPLDCIGNYGGLAMFWHDQSKVGNCDVSIRIPDYLYKVLAERQQKALARFAAWHDRQPTRFGTGSHGSLPDTCPQPQW